MSRVAITVQVDTSALDTLSDEHVVNLWHVAQANPAPFGDRDACNLTERLSREIVRRWLSGQAPSLWNHQGRHIYEATRPAVGATV